MVMELGIALGAEEFVDREVDRVGGPLDRFGDGALSEEGDFFSVWGVEFLRDVGGEFVIGDGEEGNFIAAGDDGGKDEFDLASEEEKVGCGRWFFEGFEEGVAAGGEHLFGVMDDENFTGRFKGWKAGLFNELTQGGDRMLAAFDVGMNNMEIGVFFFDFAEEFLGELEGEMAFADSVGSMEEKNGGDVVEPV
jgi:hypothetical protein